MRIAMLTCVVSVMLLQCLRIFAYDSRNVALNKPATQVSTYSDGTHDWSASHAVDGDKSCEDPPTWQHYTATIVGKTDAWWRVDLQQEYNISRVVVLGKPTDTNNQLTGFRLYLTEKPEDNPNASSLVYTNTVYNNGVFNIRSSKIARYCMLSLPGGWYKTIVLCEVEVYGAVVARSHVNTSMSSVGTWNVPSTTWNSSNVIDNVIYGDPNSCKCCAGTSGREPPWLQIDLGRNYRISLITIYGRTDGNVHRPTEICFVLIMNGINYNVPLTADSCIEVSSVDYSNKVRPVWVKEEGTNVVNGFDATTLDDFPGQLPDIIVAKQLTDKCSKFIVEFTDKCGFLKSTKVFKNKIMSNKPWFDLPWKSSRKLYQAAKSSDAQYKNLNIFVSNTSMETVNGSLVFSGNPNNGTYTYTLPFKPPISFRYLMIRRFTVSVMTICEIKYIEEISELNLCDRLRTTAITSQSSTFQNSTDYQSSNAIDGKVNYDIDNCRCCSVTKATPSLSWWQINFRNKYTVDKVEIFGRLSGLHEQLEHAKLYAGNTSMDTDSNSGQLLYTVPAITDSSHFAHNLQSSVTAQFFIIRLQQNILALCELKLFGKEETCDVGSFGAACSLKCHCADRRICNSLTGVCQTPGCLPGWTGQACERECPYRRFGHNCATTCHCFNNTSCKNVDGVCTIGYCDSGWQGSSCSQECSLGTFGQNCTSRCHCFHNTPCNSGHGTCNIGYCDPGWQGRSCSQECSLGTFGQNCTSRCHCYHNTPCNSVHGTCNIGDCEPGWQGRSCTSQECPFRRFGQNCTTECHCFNNTSCNKINGTCTIGYCDPGYQGQTCSRDCLDRSFGLNCTRKCHCFNNTGCDQINGLCKIGYCESGWQGDTCSKECPLRTYVCPFRRYGQNCTAECHCFNNSACNNTNGICNVGYCEAGWQGPSCNQACPARRFGVNCTSECHCFNDMGCHFATGVCYIGHCNPGWQGVTCSEAGNILLRLKGQINTEMSSVAHNWTSERAIDGLVGPDPNKCNCCSGTKNSQISWWRLDLGKQVSIKSVIIYSRDKESNYQDLKGFHLYLTNNTEQDSSTINTNTNTKIIGNSFEVTITNTLARYVTVKRPGVLTICEVMIFEGECRLGTYGDECLKECHCADNKPCNKESGRCQSLICKTGWKGVACDQGCPQDSFGDDCKERCFCAEDTCTTSYGACPGDCRQGYHGPHCNIEGSDKQNEKSSSNIATIGGSVGGSVAFLIIVLAAVYLFIRYRRTIRYQAEHKNDYANPSPYIQQSENSEYDTLETLQDTPRAVDNHPYVNEQITGV